MKIKEVIKSINPTVLKKANQFKNKIREFEEETSGNFIAFVDQGKNSWDVSIVLDDKSLEIKKTACDCPSKSKICEHIVAVLNVILNGSSNIKSSSTLIKKIRKKKLTEAEELIEEMDSVKIRSWLISELNKDKELLLRFKNHFVTTNSFTKESIFENYENSKKAVLGRRKTADTSEVAKILKLLQTFHLKALEYIQTDISSNKSLDVFKAIHDVCNMLSYSAKKNTTRTRTYIKKINDKVLASISLLNSESLNKLVKNKTIHSFDSDFFIRLLKENVNKIVPELRTNLLDVHLATDHHSEKNMSSLLEIIQSEKLYFELIKYFPGIAYFGKYNDQLINLHIKYNDLNFAFNLCQQLVKENYNEYKLPYILKAIEIADLMGEIETVKKLRIDTFKTFPSVNLFNDLIDSGLNTNELNELFTFISSLSLRPNTKNYINFLPLKFAFWSYKKEVHKIFPKMKDAYGLTIAVLYEDELLKCDKIKYLCKFFEYLNTAWYYDTENIYDYLRELVVQKYTHLEIKEASESMRISDRTLLSFIGGES